LSDGHFIVGSENASRTSSVRIIRHQMEEHCLTSSSRFVIDQPVISQTQLVRCRDFLQGAGEYNRDVVPASGNFDHPRSPAPPKRVHGAWAPYDDRYYIDQNVFEALPRAGIFEELLHGVRVCEMREDHQFLLFSHFYFRDVITVNC
jgi:hypothetical protein